MYEAGVNTAWWLTLFIFSVAVDAGAKKTVLNMNSVGRQADPSVCSFVADTSLFSPPFRMIHTKSAGKYIDIEMRSNKYWLLFCCGFQRARRVNESVHTTVYVHSKVGVPADGTHPNGRNNTTAVSMTREETGHMRGRGRSAQRTYV